MNPENPYKAATEAPIDNKLVTMQPGEQVIFDIKRHPIGIISIYVVAGFILVVLAILCFILAPSMLPDNKSEATAIGTVIFFSFTLLAVIFLFISNKVYWGNSWILTDDSLTQVKQTSLFDRQSSQLSMGNLEDVTAEQNGILTHMFNYGVVKAETAGERSKFMFLYCPDPNAVAQKILQAREVFEMGHRGGKVDHGVNVNSEA